MQTIHYSISDKKALSTPDKPVLVAGESGTSEIVLSTVPAAWTGFEIRALLTTPARKLVDAFAVGSGFLLTNTMLDAQGYLYVEFVAYRGGTEIDRSLPDKLCVNAGRKELGDIDPAPLPDLVAEMVAAKGDCDGAAAAAVLATERIESTDADIKAAEAIREASESSRVTAETGRVTVEGTRASSETARGTAESERITAEGNRVTAETGRVNAESSRVSAESARAAFYAGYNAALALKADKAQEAWTDATLTGGAVGTFRYRKDTIGNVYINVELATAPSGVLVTLPTGYRPKYNFFWISNAGSNTVFSRGFVGTDGRFVNNSTTPIYFSSVYATV